MGEAARRKATYQDLLQVPDHKVAELVDGELVVSPRPAPAHALTSSVLGSDLLGRFHGGGGGGTPGGWWILDEPELHLGEDVPVPDLAGWQRERLPRLPKTPFFKLAPDWVCEIVSPSSARHDRVSKANLYARVPRARLRRDDLARDSRRHGQQPGQRQAGEETGEGDGGLDAPIARRVAGPSRVR